MRTTGKILIGPTLGITAAIASVGILPLPSAHAGSDCAVPGQHLVLHHSSGYDATIEAGVPSLGPTAVVGIPSQRTSVGNVSGGITGRTIDFVIMWSGATVFVEFTGTVDEDGVAHGTSTEIGSPINLAPGPWNSTTRLICPLV